jgi:hypothetical protein
VPRHTVCLYRSRLQLVMKARNNSAVQASEMGSVADEAECVRVYDYMGVMFSVCGSVMDTDIIVCVCGWFVIIL